MTRALALGKTQIKNVGMAVAIYYAIYLAATLLIWLLLRTVVGVKESITFQTGINSTIFLFIMGIVFARQFFYFGVSNSVSRKSIFLSLLGTFLLLALVTALLDVALTHGQNLVGYVVSTKGNLFATIVLTVLNYYLVILVGMFVSFMYYRLSKIGKWLVSIIGALLVMFGPIVGVFAFLSNNGVIKGLVKAVVWVFEYLNKGYWHAALVHLVVVAIFLVGSYLLLRRMPVKDGQTI